MKLPELLKRAVENKDWKSVCAVYTAITGEPLAPPPEPESETPQSLFNMEISSELLEQLGIGDSQEEVGSPSISRYEEDEETPKKKDNSARLEDFRVERNQQANVREDGKKEARREPMVLANARKNRFDDDLRVDSNLLKSNPGIAKLYGPDAGRAKIKIEGRADTGTEIDVICALCHNSYNIPKSLAHGWSPDPETNVYRCTSCCTPAGRSKVLRKNRENSGSRRS